MALSTKPLLSSAERTATATTPDVVLSGRGAVLFLDITATPNNTETLALSVELKDPASGKYVPATAFTALTASALGASPTTETYLYTIYPAGAETAATGKHEVQALGLPQVWRVKATHSAAGAWTYSLGVSEIG